jgi:CheY-like chemotaxis protein
MVVEDEPDIYEVLLAMFEIWGIQGIAFVDGGEAVRWVDDVDAGVVQGELPELVLLDIRLPEVSGPEVGARLRQSGRMSQIAIVLITAYHLTPEQEQSVLKLSGADKLMYKPLPPMQDLRKLLDEIIAKRKMMAANSTDPAVGTAGS